MLVNNAERLPSVTLRVQAISRRYRQNSGSSAKLVGRLSILTCRWISVVFVRFLLWLITCRKLSRFRRPNLALTDTEMRLLDHLVLDKSEPKSRKSVSRYIIKIARLGGYLARANDPAAGNIVMWRGLSGLTDIELGHSPEQNLWVIAVLWRKRHWIGRQTVCTFRPAWLSGL
jgi:hypothetical protein